jgi:hypothetical protein
MHPPQNRCSTTGVRRADRGLPSRRSLEALRSGFVEHCASTAQASQARQDPSCREHVTLSPTSARPVEDRWLGSDCAEPARVHSSGFERVSPWSPRPFDARR